jgi:hypothetical protein
MADLELAEDGIAVIGKDDAAHRVEDHLEHGARAEGSTHNAAYGLGRSNVVPLRLTTALALRVIGYMA